MSGIRPVDISRMEIDPEALKVFSYVDASSQQIMPVKLLKHGDMYAVKIAVPDDIEEGDLERMLDRLRDSKNISVMPVFAEAGQIKEYIDKYRDGFSWC